MSQYRFLQDAYIGQQYYPAGTTAATQDAGGSLPTGWVPPPTVEPMDGPATNAFWQAGLTNPAYCSFQFLISSQFAVVAPPITHWVYARATGPTSYRLTGLGAGLAPISQ